MKYVILRYWFVWYNSVLFRVRTNVVGMLVLYMGAQKEKKIKIIFKLGLAIAFKGLTITTSVTVQNIATTQETL